MIALENFTGGNVKVRVRVGIFLLSAITLFYMCAVCVYAHLAACAAPALHGEISLVLDVMNILMLFSLLVPWTYYLCVKFRGSVLRGALKVSTFYCAIGTLPVVYVYVANWDVLANNQGVFLVVMLGLLIIFLVYPIAHMMISPIMQKRLRKKVKIRLLRKVIPQMLFFALCISIIFGDVLVEAGPTFVMVEKWC